MRKLLLSLVLLATSSAYATKARLLSLNQDPNGSYYLVDTRNIFLNPAQINIMKDHANFEWGKRERPDAATPYPDAEGGFVLGVGGGKLGAQLGRVTAFNQLIRNFNAETGNALNLGEGQNNVDVIYGGGAGSLHWGAGVALTRSNTAVPALDGKQSKVQAYELRGGVHSDVWEAFGSLILGASSEMQSATNSNKLDEKFGIRAGGGFQVRDDLRIYGHLGYDKFQLSDSNSTFDYDDKGLDLLGGVAYLRSLDNNARLFATVELNYHDEKGTDSKGGQDLTYSSLGLPFTLGVEADANTWLRMRASVRQNVLLGSSKATLPAGGSSKWENSPNNTSVAFGAGTSLNKFNFDGALVQSLGDDHGRVEASMTYVF